MGPEELCGVWQEVKTALNRPVSRHQGERGRAQKEVKARGQETEVDLESPSLPRAEEITNTTILAVTACCGLRK